MKFNVLENGVNGHDYAVLVYTPSNELPKEKQPIDLTSLFTVEGPNSSGSDRFFHRISATPLGEMSKSPV
jgi:hypothetical protein